MSAPDIHPLIFTDLDGTLLDHNSYSAEPADRLIQHLLDISLGSVIPITSKTLTELQSLRQSIPLPETTSVTENGSLIFAPAATPLSNDGIENRVLLGVGYTDILAELSKLPSTIRQYIKGFSDMSAEEVADATGLAISAARLAQQRNATEPFLWSGSDAVFADLRSLMANANIRIQQGGRFFHFTGPATKALAMQHITSAYAAWLPDVQITTIALGDGPNDLSMIEAADIGVIMPNPDGATISSSQPHVREAPMPGPRGWSLVIREIITELGLILPES